MRRNGWIGLGVLGISALAAGAAGVASSVCRKRLKAALDDIRAKGEPLTMDEILGPPVPDDENAAPIYERVFRDLRSPELDSDISAILLFWEKKADERDWEQTREALKGIEGIIAMIEDALARPGCRFPTDAGNPSMPPMPPDGHFSHMRALLRVLRVRAMANAHSGDLPTAVHTAELMSGLCRHFGSSISHSLIGLLVYIALINIASATVSAIAGCEGLAEDDAKRLYDPLSEIDLRSAYVGALLGERVFSLDRVYGVDPASGASSALKCPDALAYVRGMEHEIRRARMSHREAAHAGLPDWYPTPFYARTAKYMVTGSPNTSRQVDIALARVAGSMVSLALRVYKDLYGTYPDSLDGVRAKLGWRLPEDPFSADGLVYRPEGKGFILYSIGPDLKDDGGLELDSIEHDLPYGEGDIVWRVER